MLQKKEFFGASGTLSSCIRSKLTEDLSYSLIEAPSFDSIADARMFMKNTFEPAWLKVRNTLSTTPFFEVTMGETGLQTIPSENVVRIIDKFVRDFTSVPSTSGPSDKPHAFRSLSVAFMIAGVGLWLFFIGVQTSNDTYKEVGMWLIGLAWAWSFFE